MKRWVFSVALFAAVRCLAQPPSNDDFTNRTTIIGSSFTLSADTTGATFEWLDEPGYNDDALYKPTVYSGNFFGAPSLWWSWTPTQNTAVVIERTDQFSIVRGYLAVYTTTNLSYSSYYDRITGVYLARRGQCAVFEAHAGTEYQISVASYDSVPLNFRFTSTNAPFFRVQPATQTVSVGASTLFCALAIGVGSLQYQWRHSDADIVNATNHMLSLENIDLADASEYSVVVSSATGVSTSRVAQLFVVTNETRPTLRALGFNDETGFLFSVAGEKGRRYRIEYSTDLRNWAGPYSFQHPSGVIFNTNETTTFQIRNDSPTRFIRLSVYHAENEVCVNRLRQIRTAIKLCAEDNHLPDDAPMGPGYNNLDAYLIGREWPACPLSTTSYPTLASVDVITPPACSIAPWSHILEEP